MPRPIFETLRDIRAGGLLQEATDALTELVQSVSNTGKGGEIAIRLKLKPAARGSLRTVVVDAEVVKKLPEPDREVSIFFPTEDGSLSKQDPNQMQLGLRAVQTPEGVDLETGEFKTA